MALIPIVHCLVDAEPSAYHNDGSEDLAKIRHVYAVNLSFECISDLPGGPGLKQDEADAAAAFSKFCELAAKGVTFHHYTRGGSDLSNRRPVAAQLPSATDPTGTGPAFDVQAWLASLAPKTRVGPTRHYWTSLDGDMAGAGVESEEAGAAARLRAAQAWDAPVGHRFGLTYLVCLDQAPGDQDAVLPYFDNGQPPDSMPAEDVQVGQDTVLDCHDPGHLGMGIVGVRCRTALLKPPDETDTLGGRLTAEGFFKVNPHAEDLRRFLNGFEQRAASLMSCPRALASHEAKPGSSDYAKLFRTDEVLVAGGPSVGKLLGPAAWAVGAGLLASLDMLALAISKPVTGARSEGEVLAPLVSAILVRIGTIDPPPAWASDLTSDLAIALTIRKALAASKLFGVGTGPAPILPPGELAPILRAMHGLGEKAPDDASPETRLLHKLLTRFSEEKLSGEMELSAEEYAAFGASHPLEFVLRPVFDAEAKLQGEAGMEAAIVRLFETAAGLTTVAAMLAPEVANAFEPPLPPAEMPILQGILKNAWEDYRARLDDRFNGAEAVRRSAGAEFVGALFEGPALEAPSPKDLIDRIDEGSFYRARLARLDFEPGPFTRILRNLVRLPYAIGPEVGDIRSHLDEVFDGTTADLIDLAGAGDRFVPDTVPQPLPIQIAADLSGDLLDPFLGDFNGIAVAIRRVEPGFVGAEVFAHANLAELHWPVRPDGTPDKLREACAIGAILPAMSDGRGPMFVEYQGFPFVSSGFGDVMASPGQGPDPARRRPFYTADIADPEAVGQPKLPALAYGRWFQSYAFALTNAGTLPRRLQKPAADPADPSDAPWRPTRAGWPYAAEADNDLVVAWSAGQRRTAIGEMGLTETGSVPRIGRALEGVIALASDYPRLHLYANGPTSGTLDLFRETDGAGTLALGGEVHRREVVFDGLSLSGDSTLDLRLFSGPAQGPQAKGAGSWPIPVATPSRRLAVSFVQLGQAETLPAAAEDSDAAPAAMGPRGVDVEISYVLDSGASMPLGTVKVDPDDLFWLRLVLTAPAAGAKTSLSFGAPEGAATGSRPLARLLVLAPKPKDVVPKPDIAWTAGTPTEVTAEVATPRVGYLDFLRWMTNGDLRKALGASGDRFMNGLSMAYAMRHLDPSLAAALDRLPDPAVDKVRLTLATTDTLGGGTGFNPDECEIDLSDRLSKVADEFGDEWKRRAPAPKRGREREWPTFAGENLPTLLLELLLDPLDKAFRFSVTMIGERGTPRPLKYDPAKSLATAYVPAGVVADLAAEALVKRTHFGPATDQSKPPGIIHVGLLQHASRERRGGYVSFPSFALRIETMIDAVPDMQTKPLHDAFIALAERMIEVAPAASARRYDLVTRNRPKPEDHAAWRLYSHADVLSQRWLPSGRPAYRTFEPKRHAWDGKAGTAAFRLAWRVPEAKIAGSEQAREAIAEYEKEVFFDRPNIDADPLTQRLLPLPAVTLLQSFPWDWPSATYLRHRFTLRSRYAGALRKPERRQINAFPPVQRDRKRREIAETWTLRTVILADFARVQVTRPQLRALIPLTSAPGQAGTPPVLAILQEPPFAHGGLADRVTAELKTGFGYGFEVNRPTVGILDSRKEIGPDPRLDYRPTPAEDVLRLGLAAEGPIGLTFDPVQAGRPTFSNSAFLLTPRRPDGEAPNYEEHCLGVSMSRHLNPAWTFFPPQARPDVAPSKTTASAKTNGLVADRAWWVTFPARASRNSRPKKGSPVELLGAGGITALSAARSGDSVSLLTTNLGVDGVAGGLEKPIEVARLPQGSGISILHQPIAPGRFLLSVFAGPREAASVSIEAGMSATPLMMASFEWGVPKGAGATDVPLRVPGRAEAEPVLASAPTFLAWTRTLRAFDRGTVAHPERAPDAARVDISELRARIEEREPPGKDPVQIVTLLKGAQPLFLTSSTEADPFPVHVHRHLAFVLTRLLEGPGRPVEEYVGAGRFCGDQAPMPAGKASTTDRLNLRLIEMETSAAALCGTDSDAIPSAYRTRYFDLASTGWVEGSAATLFLRPVGSKAHLGKLESLTLSMNAVGGSTAAPRFEISIAPGDAIRMIEIDFVDTKWAARVIRLSGTCEPAVIKEVEKHKLPKLSGKGFFLTVDAAPKGAPGEFWCDISLLHGKREAVGDFDFGWLFSRHGGGGLAGAITAEELGKATEVQARIVSVSPPVESFKIGSKAVLDGKS